MTDRAKHRDRWHDDVAAYSLDALDGREAELLEAHLGECESCSQQLRWLTLAVDQIPSSVEQLSAPSSLRERVMEVVDREAEVPRAAKPAPAAAKRRRWLPSFEAFTLRPALAGVATVLLLAAGIVGYQLHDEGGSDGGQETFAARSLDGSSASGTLAVYGDQGSLNVKNLPPAADGDVYQAWVKDDRGSIHPSRVFDVSDNGTGAVSIPKGLSGASEVLVTREPKGGSDRPTESPFLSASID